MGAHIKKIRVLKALVLVVLVMLVSPKWRLCVFANAEEEVGSKSSDDTTTTTATKDDGEKRRIFGGIFSSWFSEGQKQTRTPSFVGKCRERCKGLNVSSWGPMCDTKNNATYANECWFRCTHDLEESSGDVQTLSVLEEGACAFFFDPRKRACVYEACLGAKDLMEFQPVCGETGETFANECIATCAKVRYAEGSCF